MTADAHRLGVDSGGTFTDLVLSAPDGSLHVHRRLSTPHGHGLGIREGVAALPSELGLEAYAIERVVQGTGVATNAVLESKGGRANW